MFIPYFIAILMALASHAYTSHSSHRHQNGTVVTSHACEGEPEPDPIDPGTGGGTGTGGDTGTGGTGGGGTGGGGSTGGEGGQLPPPR